MESASRRPVLLIPGFAERGSRFKVLRDCLSDGRRRRVELMSFRGVPFRSITHLSRQLEAHVESLAAASIDGRVDVVGFSMGALIAQTLLQRQTQRGASTVARLVAIAGPHGGTCTAYLLPYRTCLDMRPNSALLRRLAASAGNWGGAEVHTIRSTLDYMIVPATSSTLPNVSSELVLFAPVHRWMPAHPRVVERVRQILER